MSISIDITAAITAVNSNPFAVCSQRGYKFQIKGRGVLTTNDLWNLTVEELSTAYQLMDASSKKATEGRSLLEDTTADPETMTKMAVVETIFNYKMASKELAVEDRANKQYLQRVADALESKRNAALESMSAEELEKILKNGGPLPTVGDSK